MAVINNVRYAHGWYNIDYILPTYITVGTHKRYDAERIISNENSSTTVSNRRDSFEIYIVRANKLMSLDMNNDSPSDGITFYVKYFGETFA